MDSKVSSRRAMPHLRLKSAPHNATCVDEHDCKLRRVASCFINVSFGCTSGLLAGLQQSTHRFEQIPAANCPFLFQGLLGTPLC